MHMTNQLVVQVLKIGDFRIGMVHGHQVIAAV